MFLQIKGNEDIAHTYIICRFGRCFIIDPASEYEFIVDKTKNYHIEGLLLTHAHSDHVHLISKFNAPVYIHEDDAALLFDTANNGYMNMKKPYNRSDLNIKIIKNNDKILLGSDIINVIHTPGHTKGGVSFLYNDMLFTGDTLFKGSVGRHDLYSGNLNELKSSVIKLLSYNSNIKIYPGHDDITDVRSEKKNNPFYLKWVKQAKKG